MGEQVKEILNWARQRKILASAFVALTLLVGILIGSLVSGRVSATKGFGFAGTNATALTVPDPIPATNTFAGIVTRWNPPWGTTPTTKGPSARNHCEKAARSQTTQKNPCRDSFDASFNAR